jgi:hypothetical protein
MSDDLADVLDLGLAWQRVRTELVSDLEILATAETQPVEENLRGWLDSPRDDVRRSDDRPPAGRSLVRPDVHLSPRPAGAGAGRDGGVRPGALHTGGPEPRVCPRAARGARRAGRGRRGRAADLREGRLTHS